ncbi:hypothetical protein BO82DRAFT_361707 [Aspergillus uvarum CBS 121591]|uniref:Uncharacterized protein n=1 Tax=Aspergillus uvarum CBS 121591 TaxID=1448315 RepID=A0A319D2H3_9EURO|nr:hypothetical protein BO82DRAFT_361707 [Aspergillus uvarum CBS 121591]PYH85263.1 hypothetical protein BO82DRAFT_361707 [Aspergillus uvarum CBS 121591]
MLDRFKAPFRRYPDNEAGATMAVLEFLAAQGVSLDPITLDTQSEDYFTKGSRRAPASEDHEWGANWSGNAGSCSSFKEPEKPATVTFGIWGKVTGIHQTYRDGMRAVILSVACSLLYYLAQLVLAYSPPKSDWQNFLDGCKALFGY